MIKTHHFAPIPGLSRNPVWVFPHSVFSENPVRVFLHSILQKNPVPFSPPFCILAKSSPGFPQFPILVKSSLGFPECHIPGPGVVLIPAVLILGVPGVHGKASSEMILGKASLVSPQEVWFLSLDPSHLFPAQPHNWRQNLCHVWQEQGASNNSGDFTLNKMSDPPCSGGL